MSRTRLVKAALLGIGIITVACLALLARPASDETLKRHFRSQRAEFVGIVSLLASNRTISFVQRHSESNRQLIVTGTNGSTLDTSAMVSVMGEFRRFFNVIDCEYVSSSDVEIIVGFKRIGFEDIYPGGIKVIAFRESPPVTIVNSIDGFRRSNRGKYEVYMPLEGSWYVKYREAH